MVIQLPGWAGAARSAENKCSCEGFRQEKPLEFRIQLKPELGDRAEDALGSAWVKCCREVTPGEAGGIADKQEWLLVPALAGT